jgi:hypothetical protein
LKINYGLRLIPKMLQPYSSIKLRRSAKARNLSRDFCFVLQSQRFIVRGE